MNRHKATKPKKPESGLRQDEQYSLTRGVDLQGVPASLFPALPFPADRSPQLKVTTVLNADVPTSVRDYVCSLSLPIALHWKACAPAPRMTTWTSFDNLAALRCTGWGAVPGVAKAALREGPSGRSFPSTLRWVVRG